MNGFYIVTLDGSSALSYEQLYDEAKEFAEKHPEFVSVNFKFNGLIIDVKQETKEEAWKRYTQLVRDGIL